MSTDTAQAESDLIEAGVAWLNDTLPPGWVAERSQRQLAGRSGREESQVDDIINLRGSSANATLAVEAKRSLTPRDVERLMAGLSRTFRSFSNVPVLVVAPWLSPRTQELLRAEEINYIDLTGNAWIAIEHPAVFVRTVGASRNPEPAARGVARLRGAKAGRLVRALVDVRPPYGVRELASAVGLTAGYVSRLLEALDREAFIDRSRRGEVLAVDYTALLRRWCDTYAVLKNNEARRFIAPEGAQKSLERLPSAATGIQAAVTGSFAANRHAPVAAPALLLIYVEDFSSTVISALGLLPADEGANVILLRPFDRSVWQRLERDQGINYVAPSQAAADCLTGTGRMPSEGEALLAWMSENEGRWRAPSLSQFLESAGGA